MKKILVSFIIIFLLTGCNNEENSSTNNNEQPEGEKTVILEDQIVNNLTMEDFNISRDESNITYIYFDVVNNTDSVIKVNKISYTLYEGEREVFTEIETINVSIEPGEFETVVEKTDINLSNVDKVEYVVK